MDLSGGAASSMDDDDEEMVTTSLAEVLTCRNRFLEDRELWALCRECCLTLEYVHDCYDLFQSLCINPDTVAFDPEGNVCFLDLDMEPDPLYIAPEIAENGNSYGTHLYSLGMTLLYATEYNAQSNDHKAKIREEFFDLLTALTCDSGDDRPDLDSVIEICDRALDGELSQIICLNIVGVRGALPSDAPNVLEANGSGSGLLQVTDELTAYLESQSGFVQNKSADNSLIDDSKPSDKETSIQNKKNAVGEKQKHKDHNDNSIPNRNALQIKQHSKGLDIIKDILKEASLDEEEIMSLNEEAALLTSKLSKRQGMMLADMLQSLGRFLGESELWALCRECVLCLKRKKKHLPAYVSLDTVMVCDTGMITFKAIPEDKELEVVYMAPELQQKGILNEKTCLYGLGITLKSAAGVDIAAPDLPIQDGEALEILIQSFLQAKPDRRPALETALEMCQEYEKSSKTKSRDICLAFYNEALNKVALEKSGCSPSISMSEMSQWDSSNKDSSKWDSSEQEQTSSENTRSMFQGDLTEPEDNIEDIPFDGEDKATTTTATVSKSTAFKPIMTANSASSSTSSSAFKPLPSKPRPNKDPYRVPSAFSSPATHFKPIILQESQSGSSSLQQTKDNSNGKQDGDVVTKLREIKQNLMKHKNSDLSEKDLPSSDKPSSTKKKMETPNNSSNSSNLSSYMKQLKSQGDMPDTDTLASAIAKYLKSELADTPRSQPTDEKTIQPSNLTVNNNQPSLPINANAQQSYDPSHSYPLNYNTVPNQMINSSPNQNLHSQQPHHSTQNAMPGTNQTQMSYNQNIPPMQYHPNQFSGMAAQNVPSFQLTLVQDPVSGIMQMVPVPYIQVQNQHSFQQPLPLASINNMQQGSSTNTLTTSGALLYNGNRQQQQQFQPMSNTSSASHAYQGYITSDSVQHVNAASKDNNRPNVPNVPPNKVANKSIPALTDHHSQHTQSIHNQDNVNLLEVDDNNSRSSSPSPSKDSGICLTQQPAVLPYNKDSLMDRFLSSESSNRKKYLAQILNVVRGEFGEEGVFDNGVEDLAMSEYIVSLISLKWDTFCSAVKEKYPSLVWTQQVLMILYETLNKSPDSRQSNRYQPSPKASSSIGKFKSNRSDTAAVQPGRNQNAQQLSTPLTEIMPNIRGHGEERRHNLPLPLGPNMRPKSELGIAPRIISSEASDSTDSENLDKRRRFRKRYELDKKKSSSLHNVFHAANSSVPLNSVENDQTFSSLPNKQRSPDSRLRNPSVFSKDYYPSSQVESESKKQYDFLNASHPPPRSFSQTSTFPPNSSHNMSPHTSSHVTESKSPTLLPSHHSPTDHQNSQYNSLKPSFQHGNPSFQVLPSKTSRNNSSSIYDYGDSSSSSSPKESRNSQTSSKQQTFLSPYSVPLSDSSSTSPYSQLRKNKTMQNSTSKSLIPLAADHSIPGSYTQDKRHEGRSDNRLHPRQRNSMSYIEHNNENNSDSDYSASAEMRRLAAKKPELFERRTPLMSTPLDTNNGNTLTNDTLANLTNQRPRSMVNNDVGDSHVFAPRQQTNTTDVLDFRSQGQSNSSGGIKSQLDREDNNRYFDVRQERRSNPGYGRSLSAVYTSQTPRTGVKVLDKSFDENIQRQADDSDHLPEINSALLPYTKKGQVVYHSAMIQLSLTAEVDDFIHSIDEENKSHIENRLASVTQEISMQWKQRKKSQKFYRRLSQQLSTSKTSKNDQNIGGQVLKDMAEMTRKINYLFLCKTHLQMLLAELDGLDVCYLHSLSACENSDRLVLQSVMENKYLQFRTINTQQAGSMSVLQAGTPKGLLSYLYTSSALSDGFIHQFLLCFRYILTADQMFSFIVNTYRGAQRSNKSDANMVRIQHRSLDLLQFWIEGYFSIDFAPNSHLTKKLASFLHEQTEANVAGTDNLYSLYAACRLGEHSELMLMTEVEDDEDQDSTYFLHLANPKQWESFRSLLKRSKSDKSLNTSSGSGKLKSSDSKAMAASMGAKSSSSQFSVADCEVHVLAEQLTLIEQSLFRHCHPIHFLNSQFQGVGVALSMPGMRTPSMTRKMESSEPKRGLFVCDPPLEASVVRMITHSQELAHWVSAEILSCGSTKVQTSFVTKFIGVANMCLSVRNFATALSILGGLDNLVVKQLPVWKNISAKYITFMEELNGAKMKVKSESMSLTTAKDFHIYPTIPCALFSALHLQQMEVGGFTLANGLFKWDKMRSISETVDQIRIFRDHEYGFQADPAIQRALQRRLSEFSDQDLHAVASTHENNFHRSMSSSTLSGTLKKVKDKLLKK